MNLETAINDAHNKLKQNKIKTALLDSEILMSETIKKTREFIIMNHNYEITEKEYNSFKEMIKIRSTGKPIAHLIKKNISGKTNFMLTKKS